jgi:hypothetical protein
MAMVGKRFLAILAVMALGAGSAMVGLTMASGSWNVVGTGLAPGEGYGVLIGNGNDRMKLELANTTDNPVAWFSVWSPSGARAGFFQLDGSTKSAEIVVNNGPWLVFVYKAHGGDLTMSVHGPNGAALPPMNEANVERREVTLGNENAGNLDKTYTAVLDKEPALAGVYLQGSATQFHSELRTEKGPVEVVDDQNVDALQSGVLVESKGQRATMPQNLQAGGYTAKVTAQELRGTLVLVALYVTVPEFKAPDTTEAPDAAAAPPAPSEPSTPPPSEGKHHKHAVAMASSDIAQCGTAGSRRPYALAIPRPAILQVTLNESSDPLVSVYDPSDALLGVVQLKEKGDKATLPLPTAGEYVLYARGASVDVAVLHGGATCKLEKLKTHQADVAHVGGDAISSTLGDGAKQSVNFTLKTPPLELGLRADSPDAVVLGGEGVFTGPAGEAAESRIDFALGATGGSGLGGLFGAPDHSYGPMDDSSTQVNATGMVLGAYTLEFQAQTLQGDLAAYAVQYVRNVAKDPTAGDDDGHGGSA